MEKVLTFRFTKKQSKTVSYAAAGLALLAGLGVVMAWIAGAETVVRIFPGQVHMKFNAALGIVAAAIAILLRSTDNNRSVLRNAAKLLAALTIAIGLTTLFEYVSGINVGFDELFVRDHTTDKGQFFPGRMSLIASIQLLVLGACLFGWNRAGTAVFQFGFLSATVFVSFVMLIGINFIEDAPYMLKMAPHLAACFILLAIAVWLLQPVLHEHIRYSRKLYTGFVSVLAMVAIIAIYSYYNNKLRIENSLWIRHTGEVVQTISSFVGAVSVLDDAVTPLQRTGDTVAVDAGSGGDRMRMEALLQQIRTLTTDHPVQQKRVDSIGRLLTRSAIPADRQSSIRTILAIGQRMIAEENRLLVERQEANGKSIVSSARIFYIFILFVCLLLTGLFIAVRFNYLVRRKSEEKFKALLESAPDAKVIVDEKGIIQLINLQTEQMFGFDRTELIGQPVEVMMPAVVRDRHARHRQTFVRDSGVRDMSIGLELNAQRKDGSTFPVEISLAPIRTEEGLWVSASIRDIEERKRAQEKITHLARLIESTSEAVFSFDSSFRISTWNKAAEKLFGYRETEVIGKPVKNVIRPQITEDERRRIRTDLREAGFWKGEITYLRKDNTPVFLSVSNTVTRNLNGEVDGYISLCMDYSERKKLEEKLLQANAELEAFTYSVSHDLRAPIRAITGFTNILESEYTGQLDAEAKRLTGIIKTNTERMGNLIDDLLTFTRTSRQHIVKSRVCVADMVAEVVAPYRQAHKQTEWTIGTMPDASADISMLRQVWTNLISNAVKYSSGRPAPRIEIGGHTAGHECIYYIKDNGVGFNSAYETKLFQVFQRLHSAEEFEGTGVGLAIVEKIVSKHGGRVWAESDGSTGAVFSFSLPVNQVKQTT